MANFNEFGLDLPILNREYLYDCILNIKIAKETLSLKRKFTYDNYWNRIEPLFREDNLSIELKHDVSLFYEMCNSCLGNRVGETKETPAQKVIIEELHLIKANIKTFIESKSRSKLLGKVYNYSTNKFEYELQDGTFIEIGPNEELIRPIFTSKEIFPDCFLSITDKASMRENRINRILDVG